MARQTIAALRRSHRARAHAGPYDWADIHPERSALDAAILDSVHRIVTFTFTRHPTGCELCGREIHPGHTAAHMVTDPPARYLICWECSEMLRRHFDFVDALEPPSTTPYACPPTPPQRNTPNR